MTHVQVQHTNTLMLPGDEGHEDVISYSEKYGNVATMYFFIPTGKLAPVRF